MKLIFNGTEAHIKLAVDKTNEIFQNPAFFEAIARMPKMDNTDFTSEEIAGILKNSTQQVKIETYWKINPFKPWTCVNAETSSASLIRINTRCFSSDLKTGVNTLVHESVHAIDLADGNLDFNHVDNRNDGEEDNTAPWAIGELAKGFV